MLRARLGIDLVVVGDAVGRSVGIGRPLGDRPKIDDAGAEVGDLLQPGDRSAKVSFFAEGIQPDFIDGGAIEPFRNWPGTSATPSRWPALC